MIKAKIFAQIILFILGTATASAATTAAAVAAVPEDLLKTAWKDSRILIHQEAVSITTDAKSYNLLDKADIRFDRGELNQEDIKFGLRLYPKGYTELKTTMHFQRALEKNELTAHASALSQLLASRYNLLARIALMKEKKEISTELSNVSRKTGKMLSYTAQRDRAEIRSFLKNKADLDKINLKIADVDRDYKNLQAELKELSLGTVETFDLSDFASMDDLKARLEKAASETPTVTLSAQAAQIDLEKSRAAMAFERAKDEKWFEHVEVSMKDDKKEKIYGVELAFNLPFASAPNLSRIDKEARDLREKAKLIDTIKSSDRELKNGLIELKILLQVHQTLREAQARMNPEQMRKASRAIAPQDPLLAIELQRGWFEGREQILDLEFRIRTLFILFLHESSTIANQPESNYLSKSLKRIL